MTNFAFKMMDFEQVLFCCGSRMRYNGANHFIFREIVQGIGTIIQSQPAVDCFSSLISVASPSQASDLAGSDLY